MTFIIKFGGDLSGKFPPRLGTVTTRLDFVRPSQLSRLNDSRVYKYKNRTLCLYVYTPANHSNASMNITLQVRVGKYRDIFENIRYFQYFWFVFNIFDIYMYQAFAHTLLKLYEFYYQIIVCVCVHCILGEVLLLFTLHCCGEVKSDRSCPTLRKCWGHKS